MILLRIISRLNKIHISTRKSSLLEVNFITMWRNTIGNLVLYTMVDSSELSKVLADYFSSNPIPNMLVPFSLVPLHLKENFKRGSGKWGRNQLRNSIQKGKHKIGCYPKYILIFTAYQVQAWWNMILSPVKSQQDGSNVTEILLKRLCQK